MVVQLLAHIVHIVHNGWVNNVLITLVHVYLIEHVNKVTMDTISDMIHIIV